MTNKKLLKSLGPGLLFAGAAIGVSHLVQSTRAGADFGFGLLWALILVNLFKYPFFQFGPRYATATKESLLDGYKKLGKPLLLFYFIINLATMFTIQAAVTIVTAGLASNLFGFTPNLVSWSIIITTICTIILALGRYKLLDNLMKIIIITLTISTLIAVFVAFFNNENAISIQQVLPKNTVEISFLIAFLGWMPAPLDISIWHSLWSLEKDKETYEKTNPKQAVFDFNVGYIATFILGFCFLSLGAFVMYNSGETFSNKGGAFASQLINLYTKNLGNFAYIFIGIAAFTTMFSTTLTTLDASPRAMSKTTELLFKTKKISYWFWLTFLAFGTIIILQFFIKNMGGMIKVATILSFLTAPFYAILNYILITGKHTPKEYHPNIFLKIVSILGIIFLVGFSAWYVLNLR